MSGKMHESTQMFLNQISKAALPRVRRILELKLRSLMFRATDTATECVPE